MSFGAQTSGFKREAFTKKGSQGGTLAWASEADECAWRALAGPALPLQRYGNDFLF